MCGIFKFRNEPIYIESTSSRERERERGRGKKFSNSRVLGNFQLSIDVKKERISMRKKEKKYRRDIWKRNRDTIFTIARDSALS